LANSLIKKETDLFEPVRSWLEDKGYEVFAEVKFYGVRADVVGRCGPAMVNVELKKQLSFDLLEQAFHRRKYFNYTYIAIPKQKSISSFVRTLLDRERIGLLQVDENGRVSTSGIARFNRIPDPKRINWSAFLREEMKANVGGDNGSHIHTPYKLMMGSVKGYLDRMRSSDEKQGHPDPGWVSIERILDVCETHYANPKPSLSQALLKYESDWCEKTTIGRKVHFRSKGN
jgi:hypothetical protein